MPSQQIIAQRQARYERRMSAAEAKVPHGDYCYSPLGTVAGADGMPVIEVKPCPYLKTRGDWPEQMNGYCRLLKTGDNTQGLDKAGNRRWTGHLWDAVKECGVNPSPHEE